MQQKPQSFFQVALQLSGNSMKFGRALFEGGDVGRMLSYAGLGVIDQLLHSRQVRLEMSVPVVIAKPF
jgi:hypothetical protein